MKKTLFICLLILLNVSLFSQDKASLTKEETINYIQKKLNEPLKYLNGSEYLLKNSIETITDNYLRFTIELGNSLESNCYSNQDCPASFSWITTKIEVKPIHITSIDTVKTNSSIGIIKINVISQTGKKDVSKRIRNCKEKSRKVYSHTDYWGNGVYYDQFYGYSSDCSESTSNSKVDSFYIYFLKADPTNYSKLTKALNHLISLAKAEDDPFGE